jgi:hypothetical protein
MFLIQLVLTPGVLTPFIAKAVVPANSRAFSVLYIQNNGTGEVRTGDSTTSATKGILIDPPATAGKAGGSQTITPSLAYTSDLTEFYAYSVAGTILDIQVFD